VPIKTVPITSYKLLIQRQANRIGYFIMKTTTLDKLTNEIADTRAELADTRASLAETGAAFQAYIWKLQEQNRALKRQLGGPK